MAVLDETEILQGNPRLDLGIEAAASRKRRPIVGMQVNRQIEGVARSLIDGDQTRVMEKGADFVPRQFLRGCAWAHVETASERVRFCALFRHGNAEHGAYAFHFYHYRRIRRARVALNLRFEAIVMLQANGIAVIVDADQNDAARRVDIAFEFGRRALA